MTIAARVDSVWMLTSTPPMVLTGRPSQRRTSRSRMSAWTRIASCGVKFQLCNFVTIKSIIHQNVLLTPELALTARHSLAPYARTGVHRHFVLVAVQV